ncbi:WD repeat and coiled-coil-containing protein-like [Hyla sarda]|uniref:WD repeat and coiled-coil-containing protein-like n=1 Tax=Hyla sarda TaxID=327740 RepID=UPI0024C41377|nr:WD repeat and coiled-coil-containing protein-like [Hyla sarda]XP_056420325.1 WD repeat and coiled-coil-containing protein-like [Hyla sarda]XP_056420326.1 WD repeat and coiled-coil-containing protein-like [Hyla sarda]
MELGKGKLLRSGLNALYQAIHPVHGLAWTDGKQVILTALHLHNEDPKFGNSVVIGQFEHVHGLYWGPAHANDIPALLAVQHKKHVTVWQLYYNNSEKNKLVVSQTCEVGDPLPVLPQGCVWHPSKDILVILTKRDVSVLYSVRSDNASVKADIKSTGVVHCACWTKDGSRLVVAISSALYSYIWDAKHKMLNPCSFCPIFDVGGYICAIESTVDSQVAVATELPLERLCALNAGIPFDVPATSETALSAQPALLLMDEEFSLDVGRKSTDSGTSLSTDSPITSPGTLDLTHILINHSKSDLSPLLNLKHKDYITGSGQDSSHLILVNFEKKVTSTRKVSIPGILVPDILAFDPGAHIVAVASNTCSHVLVYSLTSTNMPNIQQIQLEKNERPKGLYFLTDKMLLVLVGRQKTCDPAFLPSSSSDKYIIRLMVKEVMFDEDSDIPSAPSSFDSSAILHGRKKYTDCLYKDEQSPACRELLIPGSSSGRRSSTKKQLIEEIRSYNCDQSPMSSASDFEEKKTPMTLHNLDTEPKNRSVLLGLEAHRKPSSRPSSPKLQSQACNNLTKNATSVADHDILHVSRNLERLCCNMSNLQQRLSDLTDLTQNGRKSYLSYPSCREAPYVTIICQKNHSDSSVVRKSVLLCDNKLRLGTIQELFCLSLVEMKLGSSCWITLTADNEGFIPLSFTANQELFIRDARGLPTSPRSYDSVSPALPPNSVT